MEASPMDISNTDDFANKITINLFKKKVIRKSFGRKTPSNKYGTIITRNFKVVPKQRNVDGKLFSNSSSKDSSDTLSSSGCPNFSNQPDSIHGTANLLTIEQITNQVNTPFSSSAVSLCKDISHCGEDMKDCTSTTKFESNVASQTNRSTWKSLSSSQNQRVQSNVIEVVNISDSHIVTKTELQYPGPPNDDRLLLKSSQPIEVTTKLQTKISKQASLITSNDDLTPLSWLQSLDMGGVVPHLSTPPTPPASPPLNSGTSDKVCKSRVAFEKIDYAIDGSVKPPYSYASLIGMAMKENGNKMTLSSIYKWIKEHYVYYKTADQSWQNSIRHNLSLNKCFLKVPRSKDEPGKGGFWKLDPEYAESLVDGVFKKRRPSRGPAAPPATKSKRIRRGFPYTPELLEVQRNREREQEEYLRQKEQEEAVRSLLQQPVQDAYMPPPTNKPPSISTLYMAHEDPIERTLLVEENGDQLKDDFVWSSFLGEDSAQDESWQLGTQEVVTDITQSGDPSTYQVTASPSPSNNSISSSSSIICYSNQSSSLPQPQVTVQQIQNLPSFELSPESLGVEEDLFGTPEYSEASNDEGDSLISSFDLGVGLDLPVSTSASWVNKASSVGVYSIQSGAKGTEELQGMMMADGGQDSVEFHDFEGNLTQLTTLEPVAPVVVQQIHQPGWNNQQTWEEAKTLSLLEANLDFDKLIDLDVL